MLENFITTDNLSTKDFNKEELDRLQDLCQSVYNLKPEQLTDTQLNDLLSLELNTVITKLTIYVQGTRQVEAYTPNVYSASQEVDISQSYQYLHQKVREVTNPIQKIRRYIELKAALYKMIAFKYHNTEVFLRSLLRESEIRDGIKPMGRFA